MFLRMDRDSETGKMATMHTFLMAKQNVLDYPVDSVAYGPSTTNKIQRWWRGLHERLEKYFNQQPKMLLEAKDYELSDITDMQLLAYVFIPVLQRECDTFVSIWNSHRIREQANMYLPNVILDHMFNFPEKYSANKIGLRVSSDDLQEVVAVSGILNVTTEFMGVNLLQLCQQHLPHPDALKCSETTTAYLYLKQNCK